LIPRQVVRKGKLVNHRTWKQQVSGGMWVHWVQAGIDPVAWGELFVGNKRCLLKRTSPDARSSADAPASSADDKKRNRASLEEAFATAEAESLLDGTTPSEDYIVAKRLILSGVVTLDQAIRDLKARYTG
jgi:hypothetical protein